MLRFLLTPRWVGLLLVVGVLGFTCVRLSDWQFHRYQERHDSNQVVKDNLAAAPAPLASVLSTSGAPTSSTEWRSVTATGHYDASRQLAVLYRTVNSSPGVDVVTPFVTSSGTAVLVDRGWMATTGNGDLTVKLPPPAKGPVTLTGWVRLDSDGSSSQVAPSQGSVRAISAVAIRPTLPYPVYDGFLELTKESPASPPGLLLASKPDLGGGPSFFYGFQWLFFAALFFGFWCYFAWAEYQEKVLGKPRGRSIRHGPLLPPEPAPQPAPQPATPAPTPTAKSPSSH